MFKALLSNFVWVWSLNAFETFIAEVQQQNLAGLKTFLFVCDIQKLKDIYVKQTEKDF